MGVCPGRVTGNHMCVDSIISHSPAGLSVGTKSSLLSRTCWSLSAAHCTRHSVCVSWSGSITSSSQTCFSRVVKDYLVAKGFRSFLCNEPCKQRVRFQRASVLRVESLWFYQTCLHSVQFQPLGRLWLCTVLFFFPPFKIVNLRLVIILNVANFSVQYLFLFI